MRPGASSADISGSGEGKDSMALWSHVIVNNRLPIPRFRAVTCHTGQPSHPDSKFARNLSVDADRKRTVLIVDIGLYVAGRRSSKSLKLQDAFEAGAQTAGFVWVDIANPTPEELAELGAEFKLHALAIEEVMRPHQRPKLESFADGTIFGVIKSTSYDDVAETIIIGEYMFFAGPSFVVCVTHHEQSVLADVRAALEGEPEVLNLGPAAVVHRLLERIVVGYAHAMDGVENDLDEIENQVFSEERINATERIFRLKRHVLALHRAVDPFEGGLERLAHSRFNGLISAPGFQDQFDDLRDQLLRVRVREENVRETLASAFQASLAQIGVRQNEDMRAMAGWAAIIAVPTLIAGVWGMNFQHMPELQWWLGYPLALLTIAASGLLVRWRLRHNGWL